VKTIKQRHDGIVPTHRKMVGSADQHQNDDENDGSNQATEETARQNGVLRTISPPRAFSAGYGF
jgi:hypothetical protein